MTLLHPKICMYILIFIILLLLLVFVSNEQIARKALKRICLRSEKCSAISATDFTGEHLMTAQHFSQK